jgi:hypothetical protein
MHLLTLAQKTQSQHLIGCIQTGLYTKGSLTRPYGDSRANGCEMMETINLKQSSQSESEQNEEPRPKGRGI